MSKRIFRSRSRRKLPWHTLPGKKKHRLRLVNILVQSPDPSMLHVPIIHKVCNNVVIQLLTIMCVSLLYKLLEDDDVCTHMSFLISFTSPWYKNIWGRGKTNQKWWFHSFFNSPEWWHASYLKRWLDKHSGASFYQIVSQVS